MARKKQTTLVIFPDLFMGTKKLTNAQLGELMRAVMAFRFEGTEPAFDDPLVDMAYDFISPQLLRYQEICETNRKNRTQTKNEIPETAIVDHEVQRNATECSEMQRKATQNQTQNQTQSQNQIQNQSQNQKKKESKKENLADKPPTKTIPPTVEQVRQYCTAKGIAIDPQRFVDYYTSNGWMVGRTKMKDWTAAVRTWHGKENQNGKIESKPLWTVGTVL